MAGERTETDVRADGTDRVGIEVTATPSELDPAALVRLGTMVQSTRAELAAVDLAEVDRERLAAVHREALRAIEDHLPPDLHEELDRFTLGPSDDPSGAELRLAHAQLAGWLDGLFQGLQVAALSRQAAARVPAVADGRPSSPALERPVEPARSSGPYL